MYDALRIDRDDIPTPRLSIASVIGMSTSTRNEVRSSATGLLYAEGTINKYKIELADTHGVRTRTASYLDGDTTINIAYFSDPLRLISLLTASSSYIAFGGDKGGQHTKMGVTYTNVKGKEKFIPLLITEGKDNYQHLSSLPPLIFDGDSSAFTSFFPLIQSLLDARSRRTFPLHRQIALLNGDWAFLNAILGIGSCSSTHPCPICLISSNNFLGIAPYRTPDHSQRQGEAWEKLTEVEKTKKATSAAWSSMHHVPLLVIDRTHVVPIPLHLLLGISNRIIRIIYPTIFSAAELKQQIATIKTQPTESTGGAAQMYDMNGKEIGRWVKKHCSLQLSTSLTDAPSITTVASTAGWMSGLYDNLLHSREWTDNDIASFAALIDTMQRHWTLHCHQPSFPKLHMLTHAVEFASVNCHLGKYSEAQIESSHAVIRPLYNTTHNNQSKHTDERIRRTLADVGLAHIRLIV